MRNSHQQYSIPGKVFILGEYLVLEGRPALIAAVPPRFTLSLCDEPKDKLASASPAGRLLEVSKYQGGFVFEDPYLGAGGFGASSAQFALLYRALGKQWDQDAVSIWRRYRELTSSDALPPSGADLISQCNGGVTLWNQRSLEAKALEDFPGENFLVFSATHQPGRKVATHQHLKTLASSETWSDRERWMRFLETSVDEALLALKVGDLEKLGNSLVCYAQTLQFQGLENSEATEDRKAFVALPNVLGAKGTGALLSDGVLVLVRDDMESVMALGRKRNLRLVTKGIGNEPGVQP